MITNGKYVMMDEHRKNMSESHKGLNTWSRGRHLSEKTKENMRKPKSEEHKKKISIALIGNKHAEGGKGRKFSEEHKKKIGLSNSIALKGRKLTIETRMKISKAFKEKWKDINYAEKIIKSSIKGLYIRPTSFEQKISDLCFKYNLPFIYKGNGSFFINLKNPDFVNEKDKMIIEVFYSYFKIKVYGSVENYKEICRKRYENAGWKVIFIDENDLMNLNWENICLNKIINLQNERPR